MPGGKETRLLHLGEMEKLDKTLFRLEQELYGLLKLMRNEEIGQDPSVFMGLKHKAFFTQTFSFYNLYFSDLKKSS